MPHKTSVGGTGDVRCSKMRQAVGVAHVSIRSPRPPLPLPTVVAEWRQFHTCIMLNMMLLVAHDAGIGWEVVLGVTRGGSRA